LILEKGRKLSLYACERAFLVICFMDGRVEPRYFDTEYRKVAKELGMNNEKSWILTKITKRYPLL